MIRNVVVEYDEDRRIAWRHFARHVRRYELAPQAGADAPRTQLTETFDCGNSVVTTLRRNGINRSK